MIERIIQDQFSLWVPCGDPELEAEYFLVANQAQSLIDKMIRCEITPDDLLQGLEDFLPVPIDTYIEEVEKNLEDLGKLGKGIILLDW